VIFFETPLELIEERLEMRLGSAGADEEKIRERRDAPQIESDQRDGLLVVEEAGAEPDESFGFQGSSPW
jgi:hypothetical protein